MKLNAFRIQQYRSIKDTGWHSLAPDNITCLIGQNESGKTTILEALYSFYSGRISGDDLRSEGTLPIVACSFGIEFSALKELLGEAVSSSFAWDKLKDVYGGRVNIVRRWVSATETEIDLEEPKLADFFRDMVLSSVTMTELPQDSESDSEIDEEEEDEEEDDQAGTDLVHPTQHTGSQGFACLVFERIPQFSIFEDFSSLLPNQIDLEDLRRANTKAEGYNGAQNLLTIIGLDVATLTTTERRIRQNTIDKHNQSITVDFQEFWQQKIGKTNKISIEFDLKHHDDSIREKAGKPYIEFWVNDGQEKLYPKQRSKGVRWFISFYLQLKADKKTAANKGSILLIDEPGGSLHAKAEEDLLKVFEDIKDTIQVVYTTHSPHLVKLKTLYRILAIQRSDQENDNSETQVIDINKLGSASVDTLLPIYTLMGTDASFQGVIQKTGNVILEEISAYYYMRGFWALYGKPIDEIHFLPATGNSNVPLLCNLFLGWGLQFGVVLDGDRSGKNVYEELRKTLYGEDEDITKSHIHLINGCDGIEDIFTHSDFTKRVIKDESVSFTGTNSSWMKGKAKAVYALRFMHDIEAGDIKAENLERDTTDKIQALIYAVEGLRIY